jgi:hypothetical protein
LVGIDEGGVKVPVQDHRPGARRPHAALLEAAAMVRRKNLSQGIAIAPAGVTASAWPRAAAGNGSGRVSPAMVATVNRRFRAEGRVAIELQARNC